MYMTNQEEKCVFQFSMTGRRHRAENMPCEDSCLIIEKNYFQFYGLADGQSGKRFSKIGGQTVLTAVASYLETKGIQALIQYRYKDEIQYDLTHIIRNTISRLGLEYNTAEKEFSSTVVAVAVNPEAGIYMTVHLGDGGIIGLNQDDDLTFLSSPENGITRCYTWLTTSADSMLHLRIGFGQMDKYKKVLLFTDGASAVCYGKNIMPELKTLLADCDEPGALIRYLRESNPDDDASIVVF